MSGWLDRALLRLTRGCRVREIRIEGQPYIERHFVASVFGVRVYLHRYRGADGDQGLHDHPWSWAFGLPLTGGYVERRIEDRRAGKRRIVERAVGPLNLNWLRSTTYHQILSVTPGTWSLFVHGPRVKAWGFLLVERDGSLRRRLASEIFAVSDGDWTRTAPRAREIRDA